MDIIRKSVANAVTSAARSSRRYSALASSSTAAEDAELMLKAAQKVEQRRQRLQQLTELETMGSTQTRKTTYQAHHALHRPQSPQELTLGYLMAATAHLGHNTSLAHPYALPFIYGNRNGISIIDLRQTLVYLRRAANIVKSTVENGGHVVFVCTTAGMEQIVHVNAQRLGNFGFATTKWLPGTLTNARTLFKSAITSDGPSPSDYKPSLLILLSPLSTPNALKEANLAHVPTIAITDSDVDPRLVTYPIPANDDSPRSVAVIAGVLGMAGREGLQRRMAKQKREESALDDL